jgi:hypothetical protein
MILLTDDLWATKRNKEFCRSLVNNINAGRMDRPAELVGRGERLLAVGITEEYYQDCVNYVQSNCRIRPNPLNK